MATLLLAAGGFGTRQWIVLVANFAAQAVSQRTQHPAEQSLPARLASMRCVAAPLCCCVAVSPCRRVAVSPCRRVAVVEQDRARRRALRFGLTSLSG